jgi:hypothetical protein
MIRDFYIISKPGEEIKSPIYSILLHHFYLIAHRLMSKFPIVLVEFTVWKKIVLDFTKQGKSMLINIDVQQILTQNNCPSHLY